MSSSKQHNKNTVKPSVSTPPNRTIPNTDTTKPPSPSNNKQKDLNDKIANAPMVEIAVRNRTHIKLLDLPKSTVSTPNHESNSTENRDTTGIPSNIHATLPCTSGFQYNHNGTQVAVIIPTSVDIYHITHTNTQQIQSDCEYQLKQQIERPNVTSIQYSPSSTHISIWSVRTTPDIPENLLVYDITSADIPVLRHKYIHKLEFKWSENPPIQWSADDSYMFVHEKNTIFCYEKRREQSNNDAGNPVDLSRWKHKLHLERLTTFAVNTYHTSSSLSLAASSSASLSAPTDIYVATFTPQHTASPAKLSIYRYPSFDTPTSSKQFYKAEEAIIRFNRTGTKLLCQNATLTDRTGKSYYGESQLHCMSVDGKLNATVPFHNNQGPIQDFQWHTGAQNSNEFLVCQGFQPSKCVLYNTTDTDIIPLRDYGHASRNTVVFSPHGRYVALCGFGNLAGDIEFWDNFKFRKLGTARDPDGVKFCEWTPDSRCLITAALRPTRTVDNGYKIFTYAGELLYTEYMDECWQMAIQPPLNGDVYVNRPPSPRLAAQRQAEKQQQQQQQGNGTTSTSKSRPTTSASLGASKPTGSYIPPHLRNKQQHAAPSQPGNILHAGKDSTPKRISKQQQQQQAVTTRHQR